jgi:hypothetical protein
VVRTLTTAGACTGTRLAAYHLWLSAARITTIGTCTSLLAIEMHTTILKIGTKNEIVSSANDYHGPYYDQPHRHRSLAGGRNEGGIKPFSHNLKRVRWPLYFKSLGIEKYDGSINSVEWLEVEQLAIKAA